MRVIKVADSPMFCDNTENAKLFMKKKSCKQEFSKEELLMLMGLVFDNTNTSYQI